MKNIHVLLSGLLLSGLSVVHCSAQSGDGNVPDAIRVTEAPDVVYPASVPETMDDPVVAPLPNNAVQPIARPENDAATTPPAEPLYLNQGNNAPANVTRPLDPPTSPSIERLYQNRMEVDQYAPVNPQTPSSSPPPGSMYPTTPPNGDRYP
ncbi:MAG: hypothetical protein EOO03_17835 [Chitinophagaceae bacterium]|nr:MAG: hypothetical protein EOO03_17835 [Chitinophagaceae bacterium]